MIPGIYLEGMIMKLAFAVLSVKFPEAPASLLINYGRVR